MPRSAAPAARRFPPGGITPVFNEITALLTLSPTRPDPATPFDELPGVKDRVVMRNVVDDSGIVRPTVFLRSDTFADPASGLRTQVLALAACSGVGSSALLGGEVAVHVRNAAELPELAAEEVPAAAVRALDAPLAGGRAATPREYSVGRIQAVSPKSDFPARVTIPVYYSLVLGVREGALKHVSENVSIAAREPHYMEATVDSVPPDPETPLRGREWDLVAEADGFLRLWVRIEAFRFLGLGDFEHRERIPYKARA